MLTLPDTGQYIRLERTFLTNKDPAELAQISDSIYYEDVEILINGAIFEEMSGNAVVRPRDSGFFLSEPNKIYGIHSNVLALNPSQEYFLSIKQGENILASANTTMVSALTIFSPRPEDLLSFDRPNVTFRWSDEPDHYIYDIILVINVEERFDGVQQLIRLEWEFLKDYEVNRIEFDGDLLYQFLGSQLETKPGINRRVVSISLIFSAAGEEYARFRVINRPQSGLSGFQNPNAFSNIEGGLGLFSSRSYVVLEDMQLTLGSLERLKSHPATTDLGF